MAKTLRPMLEGQRGEAVVDILVGLYSIGAYAHITSVIRLCPPAGGNRTHLRCDL